MYEGKNREEWSMVSVISSSNIMPHSKKVKIDSFDPYAQANRITDLQARIKETKQRNLERNG